MTAQQAGALESLDHSRPTMPGEALERPVSEILKDLIEHTQTFAKQELALAGAELDQKFTNAKAELMARLLGIAVAYAGLIAIVASFALLLSRAMAPWLATLIVGLVTGCIGCALLKRRTPAVDLDLTKLLNPFVLTRKPSKRPSNDESEEERPERENSKTNFRTRAVCSIRTLWLSAASSVLRPRAPP